MSLLESIIQGGLEFKGISTLHFHNTLLSIHTTTLQMMYVLFFGYIEAVEIFMVMADICPVALYIVTSSPHQWQAGWIVVLI